MPRHALSRIAVAVFAVLVITAGVMAVAYGDARLLGLLVYRQFAAAVTRAAGAATAAGAAKPARPAISYCCGQRCTS